MGAGLGGVHPRVACKADPFDARGGVTGMVGSRPLRRGERLRGVGVGLGEGLGRGDGHLRGRVQRSLGVGRGGDGLVGQRRDVVRELLEPLFGSVEHRRDALLQLSGGRRDRACQIGPDYARRLEPDEPLNAVHVLTPNPDVNSTQANAEV